MYRGKSINYILSLFELPAKQVNRFIGLQLSICRH